MWMRKPPRVSFRRPRRLPEPGCRWMFASTQPRRECGCPTKRNSNSLGLGRRTGRSWSRAFCWRTRRSSNAPHRITDHDLFDNRLIFGDNLLALKALEQEFTGKIKCIFIDPPYNTGSAFTHYDDGVEHSLWLSLMRDRLEILHQLMRSDGSIWITLDDNEHAYCKVLCDEIFGRANFVANVVWQKTHTRENRTDLSTVHDNILVFAKDRLKWQEVRNPLPTSDAQLDRYSNPDNDPRGVWASLPAHAKAEKGRRQAQFFTIKTPSGRGIDPPPGRCWLYTSERFDEMVEDNRIWFGTNGDNAPRVKKFLAEVQAGLVP